MKPSSTPAPAPSRFATEWGAAPALGLAMALLFAPGSAAAQTAASFPDKPVKLIIPFPPGGTLDKVGRMLAVKLWARLARPATCAR